MDDFCNLPQRFPARDPRQEIATWQQKLLDDPSNAEAHLRLASWLHTASRIEEAISEYYRAIEIINTHLIERTSDDRLLDFSYYWLGQALNTSGKRIEARVMWQTLVLHYNDLTDEDKRSKITNLQRALECLQQFPIEDI